MPAWPPGQDTVRQVLLEERAELLRRELLQVQALLAAASSPEGESEATRPVMLHWQDAAGPETWARSTSRS
jgi:hypothetical protein